jgi:Putative zinc-finger
MSTFADNVCGRVVELASLLLDGRLDAPRRAAMQRHLRACPACTGAVQQLARLGRATHNLPQHRIAADLSERVRGALEMRRRERYAQLHDGPVGGRRDQRALRIAAAAALLGLAWSIGFWMRGDRAVVHDAPLTAAGPLDTGAAIDATFASTSRRVLSDLAWVPELPQHARRPLLTAQLDLFDLQARAARILARAAPSSADHELAHLVVGLAHALEANRTNAGSSETGSRETDAPIDWLELQRRRLPEATFAAPAAERELIAVPPRSVEQVVQRHADHLSPAERDELGLFLQLKSELVTGTGSVGAEFVRSWRHRASAGATGFTLATGFASVDNLTQTGMQDVAADLQHTLQQMMQAMLPADRPAR